MSPSKMSEDWVTTGEQVKRTSSVSEDTVDILVMDGSNEYDSPSNLSVLEDEFDAFNVRSLPKTEVLTSNGISPDIILFDDSGDLNIEDTDLRLLREEYSDSLLVALVNPEVDHPHIESKVDEFLVQPITEQEPRDVFTQLLRQQTYRDLVDKHLSLASELVTLEGNKSVEQLETDEQYSALCEEVAEVESRRDVLVNEFTRADFSRLFKEFSG